MRANADNRTRGDASTEKAISVGATALFVKQAAPNEAPFTVYVLVVNSAPTNTWWMLRKRFSEFHAFRSELVALHKYSRRATQLQHLHRVLAPIAAMSFPTKSLFVDSERTKRRRQAALKEFTIQLATLRLACVSDAIPSVQLKYLTKRLDTFLQVPASHIPSTHNRRRIALDRTPSRSSSDTCVVCLEPQTHQEAVHLHCGHSFHNDCLFRWLVDNLSCPLCRQYANHGVLIPPRGLFT
ncbi:hypothetical protein H310_06694 [Aphanomyces invadans]|uniref:RING-type domain-containing protein n=1 Tax=Aphanomyces invadans TaxID=157072 RepID=A0A024U594_9STRA|nr:hypothetical protein H310_06694 [Aphanomyces invadans]ETW01067.1 hypothetical protein H310_06694 [Aphanomyces invadans]|eukprot:XP_008870065.1 hypothetical protein H310_06694 [Aphanomyces invadans]